MDLRDAYHNLGIIDTSTDDASIDITYYKLAKFFLSHQSLRESLRTIARSRNSRWLNFASHLPLALDEDIITILAENPAPHSPRQTLSGDTINGLDCMISTEIIDLVGSESEENSSSFSDSSEKSYPPPIPEDEDSSFVEDSDPDAGYESSAGLVEFSTEDDGHQTLLSNICGWELLNNQCPSCSLYNVSVKEEEEEKEVEEDLIVFDKRDKIWRCINCQWEIEADDEANGYCQCRIDKNLSGKSSELLNVSDVLNGSRELRRKHLVDVYINSNYGPADSDSSVSDSSESEPDSSDERVLDDEDIDLEWASEVTVHRGWSEPPGLGVRSSLGYSNWDAMEL